MLTVVLINSCAVILAYIAGRTSRKYWLKGSFGVLFLFLALRYDYGNDYNAYHQSFLEINQPGVSNSPSEYLYFEPGWVLLCYLFEPFGFFAMIAVLALFNCFIYYRFTINYVPPTYFWLAVFLYVFDPGFMLTHSSAMRQSIAIGLFIYSIDFLVKKKALHYCLCISFAALFHASALILLPIYLLGLFSWKINYVMAMVIFLLFLSMYLFGENLSPYLIQFLGNRFSRYEIYLDQPAVLGTGFGIIAYSLLFGFILFSARAQTADCTLLIKLLSVSFILSAMGLFVMMLGRVGLYFTPAAIAVFPGVLFNTKNSFTKCAVSSLLIFMTAHAFFIFFHSEIYKDSFAEYKTIFSAQEFR
ncbi:MAG: EpsG family protein [Verrucomicrobiota bacterium]|jgi:hypothetical protein